MSVPGVKWAFSVSGLEPVAKLVLVALGEIHNKHTNLCFPDQAMLARECSMSDRSVRAHLTTLEDLGFISRRRTSKGRGLITHYTLHMEHLEPTNRKDGPVRTDTQPTGRPFPVGRLNPTGRPFPTGKGGATGTPLPVGDGGANRKLSVTPTGNGLPVHIEEPELTRRSIDRPVVVDRPVTLPSHSDERDKSDAAFEAFEAFWQSWPAPGRRRSPAKSKCFEFFKRTAVKHSAASLVDAARAYSKSLTNPTYAMGLDRWLREGRFEHFVEKRDLFSTPASAPAVDWAKLFRTWFETGSWPSKAGEPPDEPGYRGPAELLLEYLPKFSPDHAAVRGLRRNIDARKAA